MKQMRLLAGFVACAALVATSVAAPNFTFNGAADYGLGSYYYTIQGGKALPGTTRNGDNGSGGVYRFLTDEPTYGYPTDSWQKDDWFAPGQAGPYGNHGLAMTFFNGGSIVFDNNGIEDGTIPGGTSAGGYYNNQGGGADSAWAGLYRGYSMHNNWDWVYASYFKLESETTITKMVGYFDGNPALFDPSASYLSYMMNIWSETAGLLPTNTGSFRGDVFSSDRSAGEAGAFSWSDTGVDRVFADGTTRDIYRLEFTLNSALVLGPGDYYFSHSAGIIPAPEAAMLAGIGLTALHVLRRRFA